MEFLKRLKNRPDTEHLQALARIVIAIVGLVFSWFIYDRDREIAVLYSTWFLGAYLILSLAIMSFIIFNPKVSPRRRVFGMVSDFTGTGIVMHLLGEPAKVFLFAYMWVTVGNGFRYGVNYLYAAMVLSLISFSIMVISTPYWYEDVYMVIGYLGCMIILPIFFLSLLKKLHSSNTELAALADKLKTMASHDGLTGLPNRYSFQEALSHEVAVAERDRRKLAVCFIDLDGFKEINDSYGHHSGDIVLKTVASRLLTHVRKSDIVARYAGDEFVIVLASADDRDATHVAHKLIADIRSPILVADRSVSVSASVGIAVYPDSGSTANEVMIKADMAMYRCKQLGKNGVLVDGHAVSESEEEAAPTVIKPRKKPGTSDVVPLRPLRPDAK